ncbi:hypothetical protein PMZ80_000548 [Knufia obscura]|uniref:Dextranase n=2 Tax=Knufia TaxID=430999 RepID=A0AAN8IB56_9EURO|nr:hypothetical protein PMZ80_000548 [Knufia obscura]KAK5956525.1 hypothetical protein OHC33_002010 [Knufia fluminis]
MLPNLSKRTYGLLAILLAVIVALVISLPMIYSGRDHHSDHETGNNRTIASANLQTWWHTTGEINTNAPVADGNVRQSHLYNIQVALANSSDDFYDSFVYETIPRNGNGNIQIPGNLSSVCTRSSGCDPDDQITIEPDIGVDMAWTQFLYDSDVVVRISRTDGGSVAPNNVIIRPTTLEVQRDHKHHALLLTVPYSEHGQRFSVEFQDNLWEYRNAGPGLESHYVQNRNPDGLHYVSSYNDSMPVVGREPLNALLIFASPFPASEYVPDEAADTYHVDPGLVTGLDQVSQSVVYFGPGVYWFTGSAHAVLSESVTWVYLAPGAYVKGAIEYHSPSLDLRATGFGVLSGEQYVYQANTVNGYMNNKSDTTSLKMWHGYSANGTQWTVHGVTMNAPPFNSMGLVGDLHSFSVQASDYKQVGAFFGQTDGLQMYPDSHVRDVFYHVGDDCIKTYYSNVQAERMTVWKTSNAPIVQFGWYARNLSNVTVDSVDVIHTRYISQSAAYPRALVASATNYRVEDSTVGADVSKHLSDFTISNWRAEGISPALLGINPLQNIDTMKFEDIWIEELAPHTTLVDTSTFTVFTDGVRDNEQIALGENSPDNLGLVIENFYVGDEHITLDGDNWDSFSLGRLGISGSYQDRWTAI